MIHKVEISPEVVRLAQFRTRTMGATLSDELARSVVQEAIYATDPDNGLMLDEEAAYSQDDSLVAAFGVNDIVVSGRRMDVRTVDEEGRVAISRALLNGVYMTSGTLAVHMNGNLNGTVVGFIPVSEWQAIDRAAGDQQIVYLKAKQTNDLDLPAIISSIKVPEPSKQLNPAPQPFELASFVANRGSINLKRQREIVEGTLSHPQTWQQVKTAVSMWSKGAVRQILSDSAAWSRRVERMTDMLAPKFKRVAREDIKNIVAKIGETLGGQAESPTFRKALLATLTREELSHSLGGAVLAKATEVAEAVLSGRAVTDAIKDFSKNPVAVEMAVQIKKQRQNVSNFMEASAQELAGAYQQMALQPVYQTHSQDPQSGVETINEALKMLDAGELAESLKDLDNELSNI